MKDAEAIKSIKRERDNLEWINKSISSLRKSYGDRFIAVRDRKIIDSDPDFETLLRRVRTLPEPEAVTIEYVTAEEYLWLL